MLTFKMMMVISFSNLFKNLQDCFYTLKKGVLIFVQILTHLLVGFVTHLKVC